MKRTGTILAAAALVLSACTSDDRATASIGGSVELEALLAGEAPFYDPPGQLALIDARQLSSSRLATFDPTPSPDEIVDGSVEPVGQLSAPRVEGVPDPGPLVVGTWRAIAQDGTELGCLGYHNGSLSSGSQCARATDTAPTTGVLWELTCETGERDRLIAFTVDPQVVALRLDLRNDVSVVGDDARTTGLVAVEGIGTVTRAMAQARTGEVYLLDINADCSRS